MSEDKETYSPYCPVCEGCGEEGCCSPMMCRQDPNGSYCQSYLNDLKFGYKMYNQIMEMLEEDQEKNKEILEKIEKIFIDTYEKIY